MVSELHYRGRHNRSNSHTNGCWVIRIYFNISNKRDAVSTDLSNLGSYEIESQKVNEVVSKTRRAGNSHLNFEFIPNYLSNQLFAFTASILDSAMSVSHSGVFMAS